MVPSLMARQSSSSLAFLARCCSLGALASRLPLAAVANMCLVLVWSLHRASINYRGKSQSWLIVFGGIKLKCCSNLRYNSNYAVFKLVHYMSPIIKSNEVIPKIK